MCIMCSICIVITCESYYVYTVCSIRLHTCTSKDRTQPMYRFFQFAHLPKFHKSAKPSIPRESPGVWPFLPMPSAAARLLGDTVLPQATQIHPTEQPHDEAPQGWLDRRPQSSRGGHTVATPWIRGLKRPSDAVKNQRNYSCGIHCPSNLVQVEHLCVYIYICIIVYIYIKEYR